MATGSEGGQGRPWEALRADLLGRALALERDATDARDLGDGDTSNRLGGQRDAYRDVVDALAELCDVALVLDRLRALVERAQREEAHARGRFERGRGQGKRGWESVRAYAGLALYWQSVGVGYARAGKLLESGQAAPGPEGREA